MNRLPQWFRTAMVMIVVAGAVTGGMAGSAQALPKGCNTLAKWIKRDNDMIQYYAQAANAAFQASAWDEYQYDVSRYNGYVHDLANVATIASAMGC
jgi:hypothetical protein